MAEDPARAAAVAGVTDAVFAAFDDSGLTKADIRKDRDRWPFDGLQLAAYRLEVKQAQSMKEIKDFAVQMVTLRDDMAKTVDLIGKDPDDRDALERRTRLEDDLRKYRRMAESFFRGGVRWHIKDME